MKILCIDTASDICGVSILEDHKLIKKVDRNTGRTHSENLMPMIQEILSETSFTLKDMDFIVCDKGPGSFTGIRIGIATAKAFQDGLEIPCIGISSLESLAYSILEDGLIVSILDCKNDQCYFALYERKNGIYFELIPPSANTIQDALETISSYIVYYNQHLLVCFVGDGSIAFQEIISQKFLDAKFAKEEQNQFNSYSLGLAGLAHYEKNKEDELLPLYLKKPQAQRQLEERLEKKDDGN